MDDHDLSDRRFSLVRELAEIDLACGTVAQVLSLDDYITPVSEIPQELVITTVEQIDVMNVVLYVPRIVLAAYFTEWLPTDTLRNEKRGLK